GYWASIGKLERAKGFEPSTPTLARLCSTPELRPLTGAPGMPWHPVGRRATSTASNTLQASIRASTCGTPQRPSQLGRKAHIGACPTNSRQERAFGQRRIDRRRTEGRREVQERHRRTIDDPAGDPGLLGRMVRPVQGACPVARKG